MNNYDKKDFVFERDSGIEFQHAKPTEQPFKLSKNQFTVIPRLESVKAEEYNKKFEEMRKSMPKNLAYAGKFGKESVIPPGVSAKKPKTELQNSPQTKDEPVLTNNTAAPAVKETISLPPQNTNRTSPPPFTDTKYQPVSKPEPPKPQPKPEQTSVQDENVVFYTGYESEEDPFNDDTYKNQEFVIDNDNNKKSASFRDKIKHTFHKLFSNSAEEETYNYNDE